VRAFRNSRWWTWAVFALAMLVLAGGAAAALIIWQARSSAEETRLDLEAARKTAEDIADNTLVLAEEWRSSQLPNDMERLAIKVRGSLAALLGEMERTAVLTEQLGRMECAGDEASAQDLQASLASLSEAQSLLELALEQAGDLLAGLDGLVNADAAYRQGYEKFLAAVQVHNQALQAGSVDLASARLEAASASGFLQEAQALLQSPGVEGLDTEAALSAIGALKGSVEIFDQAGHNLQMQEVEAGLSGAPADLLDLLDISTWLRSGMEPSLEPVYDELNQTGLIKN